MIIIHVLNNNGIGGVQNYVKRLVQNNRKNAIKTIVLCQNSRGADKLNADMLVSAEVENSSFILIKTFLAIYTLYRKIESHEQKIVVWLHLNRQGVLLGLALKIFTNTFVLSHSHIYIGHNSVVGKLKKWFVEYASKFLDKRIAVSQMASLWLYGNNSSDIIEPFLSPMVNYNPRNETQATNCIHLAQIGHLSNQKNPLFSLSVAKQLASKGLYVFLKYIGDGFLRSDIESEYQEYCNKSTNLKVQISGYKDEPFSEIEPSSIVLMPSLYEGFGMVAMECQSRGIRIILSNNVPQEAILVDGLACALPLTVDIWTRYVEKKFELPHNFSQIDLNKYFSKRDETLEKKIMSVLESL